ncbi:MAG: hypothetical protein EPN97_14870 [Alphaproteobacteria bacterium]|nr:MAG: hypothetical protein EPN97_14870 [Alphaproteobacteria bacterium]
MQEHVSSDFWTWMVTAVLCFYLVILLRSLFVFFFMGGRRKLLEQERALQKTQGDTQNGDAAARRSSHKTVQFLA